jgi:hypothetical protein
MKKTIRLTESELVELVKEIISENDMNEQIGPILKTIGSKVGKFISPSVKSVRASSLYPNNAPESIKQLLGKFGKVKMNDYVRNMLKSVDNEVAILANDFKRMQSFKKPPTFKSNDGKIHDWFNYVGTQIQAAQKSLSIPKGQPFDFGDAYFQIKNIDHYITQLMNVKQVSPQGMTILKAMKQNADDAIKNLEAALSKVATY